MQKGYILLLFLVFGGAPFILLAQDTIPAAQIDSLYREDQFYIGITYNLINDVPSGVNARGLSGGLQAGFLRDMPLNKRRNIALAIGAGLAYDQFGQNLFIGETDDNKTIFRVIDQGVDFNQNRFSMAAIEAPIEFRWRSSSPSVYKFWRVYAGFKVGYAYWYKATFKQSGNNVYQTDIPEFDKVRFSASLSMGYDTFNFYASYSINPFFEDAFAVNGGRVEFRTLKFGLMFYIL